MLCSGPVISDVMNSDSSTLLHNGCYWGRIEVVKYLVEELKCDVGESLLTVLTCFRLFFRVYL